jgi:hypothetical protein
MQPNIVHALSTSVAGFVIAAYWLIYLVVIGFEAAYPSSYDLCERDKSHERMIESCAAAASDTSRGQGDEA